MARKEKEVVTVESKMNELIVMAQETLKDCAKFDGGTKSPGTRIRKAMQEVKNKAQEIRLFISETK